MNVDVFISYHTNSSLHIVEAIVNKLEADGVRCWYAPRDTEGAYAGIIAKAISACKVFLLILNRSASESPHILNELDLVTKRLVRKETVNIIPFHTADDDITDEAQYYLGRLHWIDAVKPPMYLRIDELCDRIYRILGKDSSNVSIKASGVKEYKLISKIPETRDVFIGRDELLNEIDSLFEAENRVIFVQGIGGIGKSELVKQYMLSRRDKYADMLFVTYSSSLRGLICDKIQIEIPGVEQSPDESDEVFYNRKLSALHSAAGKNSLIVVDNYDVDSDPDFDSFTQGSHRIIFTTRNSHSGCKTVFVKPFDDPEKAYDIFLKNCGGISEEDKPYIIELLKKVEYHTYTIELLAKQMTASFLTGKDLLEMYENGSMASTDMEQVEGRKHADSAFGHILSLFSMSKLTENDKQLLRELSLMGIQGVPAQRFKEWAGLDSFNEINKLINQSWIRRENGQLLSLHPLVCEVVRHELIPDAENCKSFIINFSDYLYGSWHRPVSENLKITNCVLELAKYFRPFTPDMIVDWIRIPSFLWQVGKFDESISLAHDIYDITFKTYGEASKETSFIARILAGCYFNSGRLQESVRWYKQGLDSLLMTGDDISEDLAISYEKVGRCYTWDICQDFSKAEEYLKIAEEMRIRLIDDLKNGIKRDFFEKRAGYDLQVAKERLGEGYQESGRMYYAKGDYETALDYFDRYMELLNQFEHPSISAKAYIYFDKGVCYYHLGDKARKADNEEKAIESYNTALDLLSKALEINSGMRGDVALDTIRNAEYLADTYAALGKTAEAANYYMSVITMLEKLFGPGYEKINRVKEKMMFTPENNL